MSKTFFSFVIACALIMPLLVLRRLNAALPVSSRIMSGPANHQSLPLSFELNQGQTHQRVKFLARTEGYVLFLTATEAVMALDNPASHRKGKENRGNDLASIEEKARPPRSIVRMKLEGANVASQIDGLEQLPTISNYFAGSDPTEWRTDIPNYARVRYAQVYPGIDMVYYGDQRQLEYDFVVAPGANSELIEMAFGGVQGFEISRMG